MASLGSSFWTVMTTWETFWVTWEKETWRVHNFFGSDMRWQSNFSMEPKFWQRKCYHKILFCLLGLITGTDCCRFWWAQTRSCSRSNSRGPSIPRPVSLVQDRLCSFSEKNVSNRTGRDFCTIFSKAFCCWFCFVFCFCNFCTLGCKLHCISLLC